MRARTVRVDRWEKTPTRTAQDKIKIKNPGRQQPCWGSLFCTNLTQPTGNLDSVTSHDVLGLLKMAARQFSQTLILITHDRDIAQLADRIVHIEDGKIVGDTRKGSDSYA